VNNGSLQAAVVMQPDGTLLEWRRGPYSLPEGTLKNPRRWGALTEWLSSLAEIGAVGSIEFKGSWTPPDHVVIELGGQAQAEALAPTAEPESKTEPTYLERCISLWDRLTSSVASWKTTQ
jgi:hypothetical protein